MLLRISLVDAGVTQAIDSLDMGRAFKMKLESVLKSCNVQPPFIHSNTWLTVANSESRQQRDTRKYVSHVVNVIVTFLRNKPIQSRTKPGSRPGACWIAQDPF